MRRRHQTEINHHRIQSYPTLFEMIETWDEESVCSYIKGEKPNVEITDAAGCTPLHMAAYLKKIKIICALNCHGAKANAQDNKLRTPLHCAVYAAQHDYNYEAVSTLLVTTSTRDIQDENGNTPLELAIELGLVQAVLLLVMHGAKLRGWTDKGNSIFELALSQSRDVTIFEFLLNVMEADGNRTDIGDILVGTDNQVLLRLIELDQKALAIRVLSYRQVVVAYQQAKDQSPVISAFMNSLQSNDPQVPDRTYLPTQYADLHTQKIQNDKSKSKDESHHSKSFQYGWF